VKAQKNWKFCTSDMQGYLKDLEEVGQLIFEEFKSYCGHFCDTCIGFIQEWYVPFVASLHCMDDHLEKGVLLELCQGYCYFIKTVITELTMVEK
jgi:hypothetical protein